MNDDTKKIKIERFLKDVAMSEAVYEVIHSSFLKSRGQRDIQVLAAERLAVDFLNDAWKELGKFKVEEGTPLTPLKQIGL